MAGGVHGEEYYGKTEHVRGMFYVTTMFYHVNFLPLWPLHSALLLEDLDRPTFYRGMDIPLYWKSVILGFLRGWLGAAAIIVYMIGCMIATECLTANKQDDWQGLFAAVAVFFVIRHVLVSETWDYWIALGLLLAASAGMIGYCYHLHALGALPAKAGDVSAIWWLGLGGALLLLHGATYLLSSASLEDALALGERLGVERKAIEQAVQGFEINPMAYQPTSATNRPCIGPPGSPD